MEQGTVLIIEDDEIQATYLKRMIDEEYPELSCLGIGSSKEQAKQLIRAHQPDLLLLDIEIPGVPNETDANPIPFGGFQLLVELEPEEVNFFVIVISGAKKRDYAILACQLSSIAFLEKPIAKDGLASGIEKFQVCRKLPGFLEQVCKAQIAVLKTNLLHKNAEQWLLYVNSSRAYQIASFEELDASAVANKKFEFLRVPISAIIYIQSNDQWLEFFLDLPSDYVKIHQQGQLRQELPLKSRMIIRGKIRDLDEILASFHFVSIHRRTLLNLEYVHNFVSKQAKPEAIGSGGEVHLSVPNNGSPQYTSVLKVSREGAKQLKRRL
ncbi:MAG: LytTR family DNA-binding domain-containing protein [Bacteroidota bacterium]